MEPLSRRVHRLRPRQPAVSKFTPSGRERDKLCMQSQPQEDLQEGLTWRCRESAQDLLIGEGGQAGQHAAVQRDLQLRAPCLHGTGP